MPSINLPYELVLRDYQIPLWNAALKPDFSRGIVVWPRRNGKDLICWNILIAKAMQRKALYFYIGPYYNQIRQIIWQGVDGTGRRFLDYIPPEIVKSRTKLDMRIELVNGSQIKLQGSDNIDAIVGTNPFGIVVTEYSLNKPEAFDYLRPILAENGGWALLNGTPRGLNHHYKQYEDAKKDTEWFHQYLTRDDTNVPTLEAIEKERRGGMPESKIQQEFYCDWVASSEEVLIPLDVIEPLLRTKLRDTDYRFAPKIMGVDVAFALKGDQAIIARRQGRMLYPLEKHRGVDNMSLATRVTEVIKKWKPDAVFIDAGRGEGVIHRLYQLGYHQFIRPVHFSGKPYSDLYLNKRAEIWCKLRDWIIAEGKPLLPQDEQLMASMSAPTFFINDRGLIQLEAKKQIKKRLGSSPDEADAVALTFADEVQISADHQVDELINSGMEDRAILREILGSRQEDQYDPLEYFNKLGETDAYLTGDYSG